MSINTTQVNSQQIKQLQQLQQQFNLDDSTSKFNSLISQSADALSCGPDCQKSRQSEKLKQQYLDAQANVNTAPNKLDTAAKEYYTYTEGNAGYLKFRNNELSKQAKTIESAVKSAFSNGLENAKQLTESYDSLYVTYSNSMELYEKYLNENEALQNEINAINTDTVTSDRKSFYESQGIDSLNNWYSFLKWIYIILLIAYVVGLFLVGSDYSIFYKIVILLCFIIYPFVINYVVSFVYLTGLKIYSELPKNAYAK